jgi:hypothetical protein
MRVLITDFIPPLSCYALIRNIDLQSYFGIITHTLGNTVLTLNKAGKSLREKESSSIPYEMLSIEFLAS